MQMVSTHPACTFYLAFRVNTESPIRANLFAEYELRQSVP